MRGDLNGRGACVGDNTSKVLEGWYYFYRFTVGVKKDGGWRLDVSVREDRQELCLLVVDGKAHEASGVKGFQ